MKQRVDGGLRETFNTSFPECLVRTAVLTEKNAINGSRAGWSPKINYISKIKLVV